MYDDTVVAFARCLQQQIDLQAARETLLYLWWLVRALACDGHAGALVSRRVPFNVVPHCFFLCVGVGS